MEKKSNLMTLNSSKKRESRDKMESQEKVGKEVKMAL
jgi:hypothetical protein